MNTVALRASIVIPLFNRDDAVRLTLGALGRQTIDPAEFEVIVVDDGSSDTSIEVVESLSVPYHLQLVKQKNSGAGAARNEGASLASAPLLIFLDADMIAAVDLVEQYLVAQADHPDALIIGRQKPWKEAYQTLFDTITYYEGFRDFGSEQFELRFYHVMSSSMAISRRVYECLGGFDAYVGTGSHPATDDTEFGYRAHREGILLLYCPQALAYHNHPRSFAQRCRQEYVTALWTAKLVQRYPEIKSDIPVFQEVRSFDRKDDITLVTKKAKRKITAWRLPLATLHVTIRVFERWWPECPYLASLYWAALGAHRYRGFRAGSQDGVNGNG